MHTLNVDGIDHALRVVRFAGHESLSRAFQLEITILREDDDRELAPGNIVGHAAALAIDGVAGREPRVVHGIVSRFAHGDAGEARAEYKVTLVPAMWRMRLRTDSRIFQGMTAPDIIADVLDRAGFLRVDPRARNRDDRASATGYQMALAGTYRARENCVQYRESDWDFINRLMEEEGIHYFFEHDASSHVLVVSDATTGHDLLAGGDALPYRPSVGALSAGEHVSRFHFAEEVRPARVVVSDYSFERPMLPLSAAAQAGDDGSLEVFEHPGDYDLPAAGNTLAQVRLEELQAARWTGQGDTDSIRLAPGRIFSLTDHPSAELNRGYLITRVEHRWAEKGGAVDGYACHFEVMPSDVAFRPPRTTPRPIIHGLQTAIVVGPQGEEIHTDEHGRVKVRFHWDRSGKYDDRCSCWMRVAQMSAGGAWGSLFIPRVGHEVVVDFLEGDPDRPLVTGSVYHGANVPPYALPTEKSKSTLKTATYPGGGGSNELRFDDHKGAEEVYVHAQKDLAIKAEHDKTEHVGNDETTTVGMNRTTHVTGLDTETVLLAQTVTVGAAQTVTVGAAQIVTVGGFMSLNVGLAKSELVGAASLETVIGRKWTNVGLSYSATAVTGVTVKSLRNASYMAVGSMSEEAGSDMSLRAGQEMSATAGATMSLSALKGMTLETGRKLSMTAEGSVGIEAGMGMYVIVDGNVKERASQTRTMVANERVTIRCGVSEITIDKSGNITVKGSPSGKIKIKGASVDING